VKSFVVAAMVAFLWAHDDVRAQSRITCAGVWDPETDEATLRRSFGGNVLSAAIPMGEGFEAEGAIIHPKSPQLTIDVIWKDSQKRRHPSQIRLSGFSEQKTFDGIGIGTTLKELERLNGRPFEMAGFDFDNSGTVTSWQGGRLETISRACEIKVRLEPAFGRSPTREQVAARKATTGDRVFKSSDPNMRVLNPSVYQVLLIYK